MDFAFFIEIGDTDLSRKISLCRELIQVAEIIEPGSGLFRGKLLVDLQEASTIQTERQFTNKDISAVVALVSYLFTLYLVLKTFSLIFLHFFVSFG